MIYLDHNATTGLRSAAIAVMTEVLSVVGNPSSVHGAGRAARKFLDRARSQVAAAVNCKSSEVLFTSGGTEANATAIHGFDYGRIVYGATEHDSVRAAAQNRGNAEVIPVDPAGMIDLVALARLLAEGPAFVAVMLANNETGTIQPIEEIAHLVHEAGGHLHVDAIQGLGKIPVDFRALGADSMSISAHKIGGAPGVGALILREGLELRPFLSGGGQEMRRRGGTENLAGIAGFGAAISLMDCREFEEPLRLRNMIEDAITAEAEDAVIFSRGAARLPNTICIAMPGRPSETQVMALDLMGICISAGSACSSGKVQRSHVLDAMQIPDELARSAVRVSLGRSTTVEDAQMFITAWMKHYHKTKVAAL